MEELKIAATGLVVGGVPAVIAATLSSTASPLAWLCALGPTGLLLSVILLMTPHQWRSFMVPTSTHPVLAFVEEVTIRQSRLVSAVELQLSFSGLIGDVPRATVSTALPLADVASLSRLRGTLVPVHLRDTLPMHFVDWNHWHRCGGLGGSLTLPPPLHEPPLSEPAPEADRRFCRPTRVGMLWRGGALVLALAVVALRIGAPAIPAAASIVLDAMTFATVAMALWLIAGALCRTSSARRSPFVQRPEELDADGRALVLDARHGAVATSRFVELRLAIQVDGHELITQVFNWLPATVPLRDLKGEMVPVRFRAADPRCAAIDWATKRNH